ncbi:hypothetical protein HK16_09750 [Acetobacter senegalensis]|uniref:Uncharacterized protein n=2 Tax=Acetobacter TaxID=434 RepID=A0A252EMC7_9PROT|nr:MULTISPECIES: hypothetical protein [Acetobacter]ATJ90426.1 hypothetical protein CIW82_06730 [Acetobacter tropicalis]OUL67587.1 hypothetical protein HK16_09750 [Acetobacter senegalensis]
MADQALSERRINWNTQDYERMVPLRDRVIAARKELFAALDDFLNHGFSEHEMDELYEHERKVLEYVRFCQKVSRGLI